MRTLSPAPRVVVVVVVMASACGNGEQLGLASFCYATAAEDETTDGNGFDFSDERTGLNLVDEGDETEPPPGFTDCSAGMAAQAELVDADGARVFVAMEARYGIRDLVQRGHFALLSDGDIRVNKFGGGFSPTAATLFLSNGDQPIVALQQGADPAGEDFGVLGVEVEGAFALPRIELGGSSDIKNIRFTDDDGATSSSEGDTVELIVGGREFSGTNIRSEDRTSVSCEDCGSTGITATWVAADNSL